MATGRERAWDIRIANMPFKVVEDRNGTPLWSGEPIPRDGGAASPKDVPRHWSSWHAGAGYAQFLVPNTYHYTVNMDASHQRQLIMGPRVTTISVGATGNVKGFFEQSNNLYVLCGRSVRRVSLTSSSTTISYDFIGDFTTTAAASFDGSTIVMTGNASNSWTFTGSAWTQNTGGDGGDIQGKYVAPLYVTSTGYVLARSYLSSSDPAVCWVAQGNAFTTAWTGNYDVGDDGRAITGLAGRERTLWVAKEDGLYYVDTSGRTPKVLGVTPNSNNGLNLMIDSGGKVWYPSVEGFFRYDSNTGECVDVSPGRGLSNEWPIYGRCTAQAEYRRWHYAAFWNGTDTYIMRGRDRENGEDGIGPVVWHGALVKLEGAQCDALWVSHLTSPPRLWFGKGRDIGWIHLPSDGDNPLADPLYRYADEASIYLPTDNWGLPGSRWRLTGIGIDNEGLNRATAASVYAKRNHGGWEHIQNVTSGGQSQVTVPLNESWLFHTCAVRIDIHNPAPSVTPKIRAIVGYAQPRPWLRDVISTTVYCSDDARSRYGLPTRLSAEETLTRLRQAAELGPVLVEDWWTGSVRRRYGLLQPIPERLVQQQGDKPADMVLPLVFSMLESIGTPATRVDQYRYGQAVYGTGRYSIGYWQLYGTAKYGTARYGQAIYR